MRDGMRSTELAIVTLVKESAPLTPDISPLTPNVEAAVLAYFLV